MSEVDTQIEELQNQVASLHRDLKALQERQNELEDLVIAPHFDTLDRATNLALRALRRLQDYTALGVGAVGLIIALQATTPEVRNETAKTWTATISAALLAGLSGAIVRKRNSATGQTTSESLLAELGSTPPVKRSESLEGENG